MIRLLFTVLLLSDYANNIFGFNVDTRQIIVFESSVNRPNEFFGKSVVLLQNKIYIGAPGASNGIGAVYSCDYNGYEYDRRSSLCNKLHSPPGLSNEPARYGAIMIHNEFEDTVIACAPLKWMDKFKYMDQELGECFKIKPIPGYYDSVSKFFRLSNRNTTLWHNEEGWRSISIMGSGIELTSDGKLVLGLPTAFRRKFRFNNMARFVGAIGVRTQINSKSFFAPRPDSLIWAIKPHKNSTDSPSVTQDGTGDSIARGKFYSSDGDHFAIGAPRAKNNKGQVHLCPRCFDYYKTGVGDGESLTGDQIGSRFGEVVISINLNGDQYDDLVIGAPLYCANQHDYDSGEIYIYKTNVFEGKTSFKRLTKFPFHDIVSGARFGSTLANLGDLNEDNCDDFAVGAPYEKNGVVYIYNGNKDFIIKTYSQKIDASNLPGNVVPLKGFGSSISNSRDVDGNGRPDFLIGAVHSAKVVLFRSLQVLKINPNSYIDGSKLVDPTKTSFTIRVCVALLSQQVKTTVIANISFQSVDDRIHTPSSFTLKIKPSLLENCRDKIIQATGSSLDGGSQESNADLPEPIQIKSHIKWNLDTDVVNHGLGQPVFDPQSVTEELINYQVDLYSSCRDICKCELSLSAYNFIKYIVGHNKFFHLKFTISNIGEDPSHNSIIYISSTEFMQLSQEERRCKGNEIKAPSINDNNEAEGSINELNVECNLGVINPKSHKDFSIKFNTNDPKYYPNDDFFMNLKVSSLCTRGSRNINKKINFNVKYISELKIEILEQENDYIYDLQNPPIDFKHHYYIVNDGPSPTRENEMFYIGIPKSPILDLVNFTVDENKIKCDRMEYRSNLPFDMITTGLLFKDMNRLSCRTSESCYVYKCEILPGLAPKTKINLILNFEFIPRKINLEENENPESYEILSYLHMNSYNPSHYSSYFFTHQIASGLSKKKMIAYIVIGVVIGLVLLGSIIATMWALGIFDKMRIYKDKIEQAEAEERLNQDGVH